MKFLCTVALWDTNHKICYATYNIIMICQEQQLTAQKVSVTIYDITATSILLPLDCVSRL